MQKLFFLLVVLFVSVKGDRIVIADKCEDKSCEYNALAAKSSS